MLHLFEAHKFLDHQLDLADWIRECEHIKDVTTISMELAKFTQWDWSNIVLIMVSRVTFLYFSLSLSLCVFARSFVVV